MKSRRNAAGVDASSEKSASGAADQSMRGEEGRYWRHAGVLLLTLIALIPIFDTGHVAVPDEGLYSAQAVVLAGGTWRTPIAAQEVDPLGKFDVLISESISAPHRIPYYRHPVYPLLLSAFYKIGGLSGLILSSVAGTWLAALATSRIGMRFSGSVAIVTLWVTGVLSPLFFYGYVIVGHSLGAAASGMFILAALRFIERPAGTSAVLTAVAAAAAILLRTEGLVLVMAVSGAVGLTALRPRPGVRLDWARLGLAVWIVVVAASTYVLESRIAHSIPDGSSSDSLGIDRSSDAVSAAWASLFRPWLGSALQAQSSAAVAAIALPLAAATLRLRPRSALPLGLFVLGASAALIRALGAPGFITGLFPAFAVLAVGLVLLSRTEAFTPTGRILVATIGIATPVLVFTMYGDGGANQWGGRFFLVLLPAAVPLGVAALQRMILGADRPARTVAITCLAVASISYSVLSLRVIYSVHGYHARIIHAVNGAAMNGTAGDENLMAIAQLQVDGMSRTFWRQSIEGRPILNLGSFEPVGYVISRAASLDYARVSFLVERPEVARAVMAGPLDAVGWVVFQEQSIPNSEWTIIEVGAKPDAVYQE